MVEREEVGLKDTLPVPQFVDDTVPEGESVELTLTESVPEEHAVEDPVGLVDSVDERLPLSDTLMVTEGVPLLQYEGETEEVGVVDRLAVVVMDAVPQVVGDAELEAVPVVDWEGVVQGVGDTVEVMEGVSDTVPVGDRLGVCEVLLQKVEDTEAVEVVVLDPVGDPLALTQLVVVGDTEKVGEAVVEVEAHTVVDWETVCVALPQNVGDTELDGVVEAELVGDTVEEPHKVEEVVTDGVGVVDEESDKDTVGDTLPDCVPLPLNVGVPELEEDKEEDCVWDPLALPHRVGEVDPEGVLESVELAQRVGVTEVVVDPETLVDRVMDPVLQGVGLVVEDTDRVLVPDSDTLLVEQGEEVVDGVRVVDTVEVVLPVEVREPQTVGV